MKTLIATNDPMTQETNTPAVVNQEVAKQSPKKTIKDLLNSDEFKAQIANALPKHLTPERFARVALTAINKNPKLAECTQTSLFQCLLDLSAMGLEPDGRRAHLIPFKNKKKNITVCTLIVDYKGLSELVYRSGVVSYIHSDVVREGDIFKFTKGELKDHVPWFLRHDADKPKEAGKIYAVYSLVKMKDGAEKAEVLAMSEVISIRDHSQGWIAFKQGHTYESPWNPENEVSEQEMFKKTAFRRLSKWLPLSPEIRDLVEKDDENDYIEIQTKKVSATPQFALETPVEEVIVNKAGNPREEERGKNIEEQSSIYEKMKESMEGVDSTPVLEREDIPWGDEDKIPMGDDPAPIDYKKALFAELSKRNIKEAVFMKTLRDKFGITKKMVVELTDDEAKEALAEAKLEQLL